MHKVTFQVIKHPTRGYFVTQDYLGTIHYLYFLHDRELGPYEKVNSLPAYDWTDDARRAHYWDFNWLYYNEILATLAADAKKTNHIVIDEVSINIGNEDG